MKYSNENIFNILLECGAVKEGHFVLASGKHSSHYIQCALLMQFPEKLKEVVKTAVEQMPSGIDTVMAAAIGGIPLGYLIAELTGSRFIFAERVNNEMKFKRGFTISPGENILIVEDVMTTGGTVKELMGITEQANAEVSCIYTIINRMGKDTFENVKLISSLEIELPAYLKENCPLCKKDIPAYRPGSKIVN